MTRLTRLVADRSGSAAAEMAMVIPMLIILMFSTFELGYFFLSEHVVQKSVRDAARYAARLPLTSYASCTPSASAVLEIQRVARTGTPDGTSGQRLAGWTADNMTSVTLVCDTSGTYTGIFTDFPTGVPVVTVTASVPYPSLFGSLGINVLSLTLNARSQSAVFGA
jgi:Flp pilus assembly protein TadG